ncbi:hypothetical protein L204_100897 [Cryptococcus depauperatus]|nr:hypothetical protein L204_01170 [Cryptococcus depauperatus CBS 7855]
MSKSTTILRAVLGISSAGNPALSLRSFSTSLHLCATHKDTTSSRSQSQATDDLLRGLGKKSGTSSATQDTVGPFPLGVGPTGRRKTWQKWSQLGLGGKVVRTTRQTGNLAVILFGGALFVVLTIALTTELFAKNSPSVLYSRAIDMIRASGSLDGYLLHPLTFTHSPHSSAPIRGTPSITHTFIRHPTSGREHLVISFWVHGRGKDEKEPLGWVRISWNGVVDWGRKTLKDAGMVGSVEALESNVEEIEEEEAPKAGLLSQWFGGLNLRGTNPTANKAKEVLPPGTYTVGEARGEYFKDESGHFTLLSLIVDIPSSKVAFPGRVVIYQSPEAETEGLLGKHIR